MRYSYELARMEHLLGDAPFYARPLAPVPNFSAELAFAAIQAGQRKRAARQEQRRKWVQETKQRRKAGKL